MNRFKLEYLFDFMIGSVIALSFILCLTDIFDKYLVGYFSAKDNGIEVIEWTR